MTKKEKTAWFWYYYKWFVVLAAGLTAFAIWGGVSFYREYTKEYIANVQLVNCESYTVDRSDYFERFAETYGYGSNQQISLDSTVEVNLNGGGQSSSAGLQVLAAMFLTGDIDIFVSDKALFELECEKHAFEDLRNVLTAEQMAEYEPYLYYAADPDTGETIPCGLYLEDSSMCGTEGFYHAEDQPIVGVASQAQATEEDTANLLEYFMR